MEQEQFATREEWVAAGMPPQLEPPPEPETAPPPPPPVDLQQREQELRKAIVFSEKVAAGEVLPSEAVPDQYGAKYWESIKDIRAKLDLLQQAKQVEESYTKAGVELTPEAKQYIEQARAVVTSSAAPFVQVSPEGDIEIIAPLTTAEGVGVPLSEFERLGFAPEILQEVKVSEEQATRQKEIIAELGKYPDIPTAIREGQIDLVREAEELGLITPMQVVDVQIAASAVQAPIPSPEVVMLESPERVQALSDLESYKRIIPEEGVFMVAEGQEPPMREVYLIAQYLNENEENLDAALLTLGNAGFTDEQIQQARFDAFASVLGGISAVAEDVKKPDWFETKVFGFENWAEELQSDLDESLEDVMGKAFLARLGITLAGGLAKTALVTATALPILAGKAIINPVGAPALVWETGKGMFNHVKDTAIGLATGRYIPDLMLGNASNLAYDTSMSFLIVKGAGKVGKATVSRVVTYVAPRGVPLSMIAKELSTSRIKNIPEITNEMAEAINIVERRALTAGGQFGGEFTGEVPIKGTPYVLRYLKTPIQQKIGDILWHGTRNEFDAVGNLIKESALDIGKRQGGIVAGEGGLYTSPWAAVAFSRGKNPGLMMILTDSSRLYSGVAGFREGMTSRARFIQGADEGFYGSSKGWRGTFETEIVGAPRTEIVTAKVPLGADLSTRMLVGDYAEFFTYDAGKYVPIKIGVDTAWWGKLEAARIPKPLDLYAVKLLALKNALRDTTEALKHPTLVLKDVAGTAKAMLDIDRMIRGGEGGGMTALPGVRNVYLITDLGAKLKMIASDLWAKAMRKTRIEAKEKGIELDSKAFRELYDRNLEAAYRANADSIMNQYTTLARGYATSESVKSKFEAAYLGNLGVTMEALVKSSDEATESYDAVYKDASISSDYQVSKPFIRFPELAPRRDEIPFAPIPRTRREKRDEDTQRVEERREEEERRIQERLETPKEDRLVSREGEEIPETPITPREPTRRPEEPRTPEEPTRTPEILRPPERPPTTPPPPTPVPLVRDKDKKEKEEGYPEGTNIWIQGRPNGIPMFKIQPPPYTHTYTSYNRGKPAGYIDQGFTGKGMAKKSLQVVGGILVNDPPDYDMGAIIVDIEPGGVKGVDVEFRRDERDAPKGKVAELEIVETERPYQGREYEAIVKANTREELEGVIDEMSRDAVAMGLENVKVVSIEPDADGSGYQATILAHNFNPFKWVKEKAGTLAGRVKGIFHRNPERAERIVREEVSEAKEAKETAVEEIREAERAKATAREEEREAREATELLKAQERVEAERARAIAEAETKEAGTATKFARVQEQEAMEASTALEEAKSESIPTGKEDLIRQIRETPSLLDEPSVKEVLGEDYERVSEEIKDEAEFNKPQSKLGEIVSLLNDRIALTDSQYRYLMRQTLTDADDAWIKERARELKKTTKPGEYETFPEEDVEVPTTAKEKGELEEVSFPDLMKKPRKEIVLEIRGEESREVEVPEEVEPVRKLVGAQKEKLPYQWGNMSVYLVDGNYVRKTTDTKFVGGISNFTNPNVPANEIWIENTGKDLENKKATLRQFLEMKFQGAGLDFEEARRKSFEMIAKYPDEAAINLGLWETTQVDAPPKRPQSPPPISEVVSETQEKDLDIDALLLGVGKPKSIEDEKVEEDTVIVPEHVRRKPKNFRDWFDDRNYPKSSKPKRGRVSPRKGGRSYLGHSIVESDLGESI